MKYQSKVLRFIGFFYLIASIVVLLSPGFPDRIMAAVISLTVTALCLIGSRPIVIHLDEASDLVRVKRPSSLDQTTIAASCRCMRLCPSRSRRKGLSLVGLATLKESVSYDAFIPAKEFP